MNRLLASRSRNVEQHVAQKHFVTGFVELHAVRYFQSMNGRIVDVTDFLKRRRAVTVNPVFHIAMLIELEQYLAFRPILNR